MPPKKQFGLIKRKKPESTLVKSKLSFFDDDGDNDGEEHTVQAEKKRIEAELKTVAAKKKMNKQTQVSVWWLFNPRLVCLKREHKGSVTTIKDT